MTKPKLTIEVRGGVIQNTIANQDMDICIVDYENEAGTELVFNPPNEINEPKYTEEAFGFSHEDVRACSKKPLTGEQCSDILNKLINADEYTGIGVSMAMLLATVERFVETEEK